MSLIKRAFRGTDKDDFSRARVGECLQALGLCEKDSHGYLINCPDTYRYTPRFEGFWGQEWYDLEQILKDAKQAYLTRIAELHPDKHPEKADEARRVIAAWKQCEKIFARHNIRL